MKDYFGKTIREGDVCVTVDNDMLVANDVCGKHTGFEYFYRKVDGRNIGEHILVILTKKDIVRIGRL